MTTWATGLIAELHAGKTVQFRPRGHSMRPRVEDGELVTVVPAKGQPIEVGAVVLCRVRGRDYLHLVKAKDGDRYQIGNNRGHVNGWVTESAIFGILQKGT